jgi:hypothetical protein
MPNSPPNPPPVAAGLTVDDNFNNDDTISPIASWVFDDTLKQDVNTLKNDVSTLNDNVASIDVRLGSLEGLNDNVASIDVRLGSLEGSLEHNNSLLTKILEKLTESEKNTTKTTKK